MEIETTLSSTREDEDGEIKASRPPDVVTKRAIMRAENSFDQALDIVKLNAATFARKLKELPEQEQPTE